MSKYRLTLPNGEKKFISSDKYDKFGVDKLAQAFAGATLHAYDTTSGDEYEWGVDDLRHKDFLGLKPKQYDEESKEVNEENVEGGKLVNNPNFLENDIISEDEEEGKNQPTETAGTNGNDATRRNEQGVERPLDAINSEMPVGESSAMLDKIQPIETADASNNQPTETAGTNEETEDANNIQPTETDGTNIHPTETAGTKTYRVGSQIDDMNMMREEVMKIPGDDIQMKDGTTRKKKDVVKEIDDHVDNIKKYGEGYVIMGGQPMSRKDAEKKVQEVENAKNFGDFMQKINLFDTKQKPTMLEQSYDAIKKNNLMSSVKYNFDATPQQMAKYNSTRMEIRTQMDKVNKLIQGQLNDSSIWDKAKAEAEAEANEEAKRGIYTSIGGAMFSAREVNEKKSPDAIADKIIQKISKTPEVTKLAYLTGRKPEEIVENMRAYIKDYVVGHEQEQAKIGSNAEYYLKNLRNNMVGRMFTSAVEPLSMRELNQSVLSQYEQGMGEWEKFGGNMLNLGVDMLTTMPVFGGVGSVVGRAAFVPYTIKMMTKGKDVVRAFNIAMRTATRGEQLASSILGGAGTFGSMEATNAALAQWQATGHVDPSEVWKQAGHGAVLGAITGGLAGTIGQITRGMSLGQKVAASSIGLGAEAGVFATSEWVEQSIREQSMSEADKAKSHKGFLQMYFENLAMVGGMKLIHGAMKFNDGIHSTKTNGTMDKIRNGFEALYADHPDMLWTQEELDILTEKGIDGKDSRAKLESIAKMLREDMMSMPESVKNGSTSEQIDWVVNNTGIGDLYMSGDVPEIAKNKLNYFLTGKPMSYKPVINMTQPIEDGKGGYYVDTYVSGSDPQIGTFYDRKTFKTLDDAQKWLGDNQSQVEKNRLNNLEYMVWQQSNANMDASIVDIAARAQGVDPNMLFRIYDEGIGGKYREYLEVREGKREATEDTWGEDQAARFEYLISVSKKMRGGDTDMTEINNIKRAVGGRRGMTVEELDAVINKPWSDRDVYEQRAVCEYMDRLAEALGKEGKEQKNYEEARAQWTGEESGLVMIENQPTETSENKPTETSENQPTETAGTIAGFNTAGANARGRAEKYGAVSVPHTYSEFWGQDFRSVGNGVKMATDEAQNVLGEDMLRQLDQMIHNGASNEDIARFVDGLPVEMQDVADAYIVAQKTIGAELDAVEKMSMENAQNDFKGIEEFVVEGGRDLNVAMLDGNTFVYVLGKVDDVAYIARFDGEKYVKESVPTSRLENEDVYNLDEMIEERYNSYKGKYTISVEFMLEHHLKTEYPEVGKVLKTYDGDLYVANVDGEEVSLVHTVYDANTGQMKPKSEQPIVMSIDEVLKAQDDYHDKVREVEAEEEARLKAEEEARLKAEEEAKAKAEEEARTREEEQKRAEEEAKAKAEEGARVKAEEEAMVKAEEEARTREKEQKPVEISNEQKRSIAAQKAAMTRKQSKNIGHSAEWKEAQKKFKEAGYSDLTEMIDDTEPKDIKDVAAMIISSGDIMWNTEDIDGRKIKGAAAAVGFGEPERKKLFTLFRTRANGGISVEEAGDRVTEMCSQLGVPYDESDAMAGYNAIVDVLQSAHTTGDILYYTEKRRVDEAMSRYDDYEEQREMAGDDGEVTYSNGAPIEFNLALAIKKGDKKGEFFYKNMLNRMLSAYKAHNIGDVKAQLRRWRNDLIVSRDGTPEKKALEWLIKNTQDYVDRIERQAKKQVENQPTKTAGTNVNQPTETAGTKTETADTKAIGEMSVAELEDAMRQTNDMQEKVTIRAELMKKKQMEGVEDSDLTAYHKDMIAKEADARAELLKTDTDDDGYEDKVQQYNELMDEIRGELADMEDSEMETMMRLPFANDQRNAMGKAVRAEAQRRAKAEEEERNDVLMAQKEAEQTMQDATEQDEQKRTEHNERARAEGGLILGEETGKYQESTLAMLDSLGRATKTAIEFRSNQKIVDDYGFQSKGFYDEESNTLVINADYADGNDAILKWVSNHEVTHTIKKNNDNEIWNGFVELVKMSMGEKFQKDFDEISEIYRRASAEAKENGVHMRLLTDDEIIEEVVANWAGDNDMLGDPEMTKMMIEDAVKSNVDPQSLARLILTYLSNWINKLKALIEVASGDTKKKLLAQYDSMMSAKQVWRGMLQITISKKNQAVYKNQPTETAGTNENQPTETAGTNDVGLNTDGFDVIEVNDAVSDISRTGEDGNRHITLYTKDGRKYIRVSGNGNKKFADHFGFEYERGSKLLYPHVLIPIEGGDAEKAYKMAESCLDGSWKKQPKFAAGVDDLQYRLDAVQRQIASIEYKIETMDPSDDKMDGLFDERFYLMNKIRSIKRAITMAKRPKKDWKRGEENDATCRTAQEQTETDGAKVGKNQPAETDGDNRNAKAGVYTDKKGQSTGFVQLEINWDEVDAKNQPTETAGTKAEASADNNQPTETAGTKAETKRIRAEKKEKTPEDFRLRQLKEGEVCFVERRYEEDKSFVFNGKTKIKNADDVAYLFRSLEDKSVEHAFLCMIKKGKPMIVHIGMGAVSETLVDLSAGMTLFKGYNPDAVIMVHNHPSGSLVPSTADKDIMVRLRNIFGNKLHPGVIIDQMSGKYATFDSMMGTSVSDVPKDQPTETAGTKAETTGTKAETDVTKDYKVYSFSKNVFSPEYKFGENVITDSEDASKFISAQRLGEKGKLCMLALNNKHAVYANLILGQDEINDGNISKVADEIVYNCNSTGATSCMLYGSMKLENGVLNKLKMALKGKGCRLLDVLQIEGRNYKSAYNNGIISEDEAQYGSNQPTETAGTNGNGATRRTAQVDEGVKEVLDGKNVIVEDKDGNPVVTKTTGKVKFSVGAWKGEDKNVPNTRDIVVKYAQEHGGWDIVEKMDQLVDMSDRMMQKGADGEFEFKTYAKWADTSVVLDKYGNPAFSIIKKNGEYPLNIDASTNCKKREETNAVLNDLITEGLIGKDGLSEEDIIALKKIITKHGLEIACDICFVDERRYHAESQGKTVAGDHNSVLETYLLPGSGYTMDDLPHFNFAGDETIDNNKQIDVEKLNWDKLQEAYEKVNKDTRMGLIIERLLNDHSLAKVADWTDFISTQGKIGERKSGKEGEYMNDVFNRIGASIMKRSEPQAQNTHQILTDNSIGSGSNFTYIPKTIGRDENGNMYWVDPEDGKKMFGETEADRYNVYLIGGVRLQSFSDAQAWYWFDDAETICDLALKHLGAHKYTKELWNAKAFGKTGLKQNLSAVPRIIEGVYAKDNRWGKKGEPIAPGLDENGDLLWADHYMYDGDKIIGSIQSIDVQGSIEVHKTPGYSGDTGVIGVGVSDEQIISMQENMDYSQIIGFHSALSGDVKHGTGLEAGKNYVKCQRERQFRDEAERQAWLNGEINSTDNAVGSNINRKKAVGTWNLYEALDRLNQRAENGEISKKDVMDMAANEYLDLCWDNGVLPEFDQYGYLREEDWHGIKNFRGKLLMGEDGKPMMRPRYFMHLTDYCIEDGITGEYAPQRAVRMEFPTNEDAFGSFETLIKDAVKMFDDIELKRDDAHESIKQEYREMVYKKNQRLKQVAEQGWEQLRNGMRLTEEQKYAIQKAEGVTAEEVDKMQLRELDKYEKDTLKNLKAKLKNAEKEYEQADDKKKKSVEKVINRIKKLIERSNNTIAKYKEQGKKMPKFAIRDAKIADWEKKYADIVDEIQRRSVPLQRRVLESRINKDRLLFGNTIYLEGLEDYAQRLKYILDGKLPLDYTLDRVVADRSSHPLVRNKEKGMAGYSEKDIYYGGSTDGRRLTDEERAIVQQAYDDAVAEIERREQAVKDIEKKYHVVKGWISFDNLRQLYIDFAGQDEHAKRGLKLLDAMHAKLDGRDNKIFLGRIEPGVAGSFNPYNGDLAFSIDEYARDQKESRAYTILHEYTHKMLVDKIAQYVITPWKLNDTEKDAIATLESIYQELKNRFPKDKYGRFEYYGESALQEMVAEWFKPSFRKVLEGMKYEKQGYRNLWQRLLDAIKRLLGIQPTETAGTNVNDATRRTAQSQQSGTAGTKGDALKDADEAIETLLNGFDEKLYDESRNRMMTALRDLFSTFKSNVYEDVYNELSGEEKAMADERLGEIKKADEAHAFEQTIEEAGRQKETWEQDFGSGATSINSNKLPTGFGLVDKVDGWKEGNVALDMGGGRFDNAVEMLKDKGVELLVFDPYNRETEHNRKVAERMRDEGADTTICNNCLNVINSEGARSNVILQCAKALKPGGTSYFTVYEGDGSGEGKQTKEDCWQENRKTADYVDEIKQHYNDVSVKGKLIIAKDPKETEETSYWNFNGLKNAGGVRFALADVKERLNKPADGNGWHQERATKTHGINLATAGTLFSGGGLVEQGLKEVIEPKFAAEWDEKIAGVYRQNNGDHIIFADATTITLPDIMKATEGGHVDYLHTSPVCKNFSGAKLGRGEQESDMQFANACARAIMMTEPDVYTLENVPAYRGSDALKKIERTLDVMGYTYDENVIDAADYGAGTSRRRLILRAVKEGITLPPLPAYKERGNWWDKVEDVVWDIEEDWRKYPDIVVSMAEYVLDNGHEMDEDFKCEVPRDLVDAVPEIINTNTNWVLVLGKQYGKYRVVGQDQPAPTITANNPGCEYIIDKGYSDKPNEWAILKVTPRMLARIQGLSDDYVLPKSATLAHTIIGNGVPVELSKEVLAPMIVSRITERKEREKASKRVENMYMKRAVDYLPEFSRGTKLEKELRDLFNKYVMQYADDNIVPFLSPNMIYKGKVRDVAHAIKGEKYQNQPTETAGTKTETDFFGEPIEVEGVKKYTQPRELVKISKEAQTEAIKVAAEQMARLVPQDAVLVPMPGRTGKATDTVELANAISALTGAPMADVLKGRVRQSAYESRQKGNEISPEAMGMYVDGELPEGKRPIIIDNVIARGNTAAAAVRALKGGVVLSYVYAGGLETNAISLKNAELVQRGDDGQIIPLNERMNPAKHDVRFAVISESDPFYSNAGKAVMDIKQEKATPEQWLKMIEKNGGLKKGEDKWMGLSDWLNESQDKTLTKDEVLKYIQDNAIKIEEVHYGLDEAKMGEMWAKYQGEFDACVKEIEDKNQPTETDGANGNGATRRTAQTLGELEKEYDEFSNRMYDKYGASYAIHYTEEEEAESQRLVRAIKEAKTNNRLNKYVIYADAFDMMEEKYGKDFGEAFEVDIKTGKLIAQDGDMYGNNNALDRMLQSGKSIDDTRLGYTTDGLENKKEIALTVPSIEPYNESDTLHFGDAGEGRAVAWVRFGDAKETDGLGMNSGRTIMDELEKKYGTTMDKDAMSDEDAAKYVYANYLERGAGSTGGSYIDIEVDFPDREDAVWDIFTGLVEHGKGGAKVLVIDEVQSKRHQDARDKGYGMTFSMAVKEAAEYIGRSEEFVTDNAYDVSSIFRRNAEKSKDPEKCYKIAKALIDVENEDTVPDAPFDKNWMELGMKRMLRYAAENGYDKVAWTTGTQQAERYDLKKVIDGVTYSKNESGTYYINCYKGKPEHGNSVFAEFDVPENKLAETVGKELADMIINNDGEQFGSMKTIRLDDTLAVGGEGMKGFYDKMIPAFMSKYAKKWGAKVGEVKLDLPRKEDREMWAVDVTPEMKESVMKGQPMFALADVKERIKRREDAGFNPADMNGIVADGIGDAELNGIVADGIGNTDENNVRFAVVNPGEEPRRRRGESVRAYEERRNEWRAKMEEFQRRVASGEDVAEEQTSNISVEANRLKMEMMSDTVPSRKADESADDYNARFDAWKQRDEARKQRLEELKQENIRVQAELSMADEKTDDQHLWEGTTPGADPFTGDVMSTKEWEDMVKGMKEVGEDIGQSWSKKQMKKDIHEEIIQRRKYIETSNLEDVYFVDDLIQMAKYGNDQPTETAGTKMNKDWKNILRDVPYYIEYESTLKRLKEEELGKRLEAGERDLTLDDIQVEYNPFRSNEEDRELLGDIAKKVEDWFQDAYNLLNEEGVLFGAQQLEDYVTHIWDFKRSPKDAVEKYRNYVTALRQRSPYTRHRVLPSLQDGLEMGLVPKYDDITGIILDYGHRATETIANKRLVDFLMNFGLEIDNGKDMPSIMPIIVDAKNNDSNYVRVENQALEGKKVLRDAVPYISPVFGRQRILDPTAHPEMQKWIDRLFWNPSSVMKKLNLSMSFFHHGALTETAIALINPARAAKVLGKGIFWDWAVNGKVPAMNDRAATRDAVNHLVSLGATNDYAATDVQNLTTQLKKFLHSMPTNAMGTAYLADALDFLNAGSDKLLWDVIHDGYKIESFKKMANEIRRMAEKQGWGYEKTEQALMEAGQFVNDTFGGQHWDVLGVSPMNERLMRAVLLSPDWTISTLRQALAPLGVGTLYESDSFWTKMKKQGLGKTLKDTTPEGLRKKYGRIFWVNAALYFGVLVNAWNAWNRWKDEEEQNAEAEEKRKTYPEYKSPYELIYPDGMKWYDYTMFGNTLGQSSHLFWDRDEQGREVYARWGKQFRELPELLIDNQTGQPLFPSPLINKMAGKANPMVNTLFTLISGHSLNGWENKDMKDTKGWEREVARLHVMAKAMLPYSIPTDSDKEFMLIDLVMPTSKGMSYYKARQYMEKAVLAGDMNYVAEVYKACVQNGLDPMKIFEVVKQNIELEAKKQMIDGVNDVSDACKRFDESSNVAERKKLIKYIEKQYAGQDYDRIEMNDMVDQARAYVNGESVSEEKNDEYIMRCNSLDIAREWRIKKMKAGVKTYYDTYKSMLDEEEDFDDPESAEAINYRDKNLDRIALYMLVGKYQYRINKLKKQLDKGVYGTAVMQMIREAESDLLKWAEKPYEAMEEEPWLEFEYDE